MTSALATAQSLQKGALGLFEGGDQAGAIVRRREALAALSGYELNSPRAIFLLYSVGSILERAGIYSEAEECGKRGLAVVESRRPASPGSAEHLLELRVLTLPSNSLRQPSRYAEAESPLARAIEIAETLADRPEERANAWNNLGILLQVCRLVRERGARLCQRTRSQRMSDEQPRGDQGHNTA